MWIITGCLIAAFACGAVSLEATGTALALGAVAFFIIVKG